MNHFNSLDKKQRSCTYLAIQARIPQSNREILCELGINLILNRNGQDLNDPCEDLHNVLCLTSSGLNTIGPRTYSDDGRYDDFYNKRLGHYVNHWYDYDDFD
jgi:hypothetical protein